VSLSRESVRLNPIVTRYAWPSELDLMARIAGLRLKERWADWDRRPLTSTSRNIVSVYGR
ncbi:MAG: SAM-dependent methyltransferase, partial [Actinomycetota bacterium]|nr:SAM-dependent methyltransferase [Actinomycetota bacterium]